MKSGTRDGLWTAALATAILAAVLTARFARRPAPKPKPPAVQPAKPRPPEVPVQQVMPDRYVISRAALNGVLDDLSQLTTQARLIRSFKNGAPNGYKLFSIEPGSLYSRIGLRNGDNVQSINGYPLTGPDQALEAYQKLRTVGRFDIDLDRRGEPMRKSIAVE
jgi:general secretion pathway protein C